MRAQFRPLFLALILPAVGCASAGGVQPAGLHSAVALRSVQTRSYEATTREAVLRALVDTMQDEGFRITRTEPELGLLMAEKDSLSKPGLGKRALRAYVAAATYGIAGNFWHEERTVLEAAAHVSEADGGAKVRFTLQTSVFRANGRPLRTGPIEDVHAYQALFARLDKSLYLQREGL
jgi:hypothetical protein